MKQHSASEKKVKQFVDAVVIEQAEKERKEIMWRSDRINGSKDVPRAWPATLDERSLSGQPNFPISRDNTENS